MFPRQENAAIMIAVFYAVCAKLYEGQVMVMGPMGLGTKNHYTVEDQQQISKQAVAVK
jgi:hypothetical protein